MDFLQGRIDYERTLAIPYGQRDFKLDRMRELVARLGRPHERFPIIHVAGTKGKGSTAAMIAAMLTAAGLRSGLYSSPHLDRVEERLAIDGQPCPPGELAVLIDQLRPTIDQMDAAAAREEPSVAGPTYFEVITALALMHFARHNVDAAVLEVGLGGRLDSTNVCQPAVAVITSISFDHTRQLGNTLAAIAGEKAGIIKPGVPVVSGVTSGEPRKVIEEVARRNGCTLAQLGVDFDFDYRPPQHLETADAAGRIDFRHRAGGDEFALGDVALGLIGRHQAANAAVALATIAELRRQGWQLPEAALRRGLAEVRWPARVEVIGRRPTIVLDAAHNVASVEAFASAIDESFAAGPRLLVFATTRDKDIDGMLRVLLPKFDQVIFTRYVSNPRGVPPEELACTAEELPHGALRVCGDPAEAWRLARDWAAPNHLIGITGSFFIAAEMRAAIQGRSPATIAAVRLG